MANPLLTLILPNRGRSKYLDFTLTNLAEINDQRIEILFLDNSEPEDGPLKVPLGLSNFRKVDSVNKLSMTKNWFRGLSLARGIWICYIGSDDGIVSENISAFLDFLENATLDVVSTHPIYFQYPLDYKEAWADIPSREISTWSKNISYLSYAAVVFPKLKLDLPVPYNRSVVRSSLLEDYIRHHDDILGVSPDDFLGQYIAQKAQRGTYIEMPVFIHGGSERSNGLQVGSGASTKDSRDFLNDSSLKFEHALRKYGISCSFSLSYEHFAKARLSQSKPTPHMLRFISVFLAELFCENREHHSSSLIISRTRKLLIPIYETAYRVFEKLGRLRISDFVYR